MLNFRPIKDDPKRAAALWNDLRRNLTATFPNAHHFILKPPRPDHMSDQQKTGFNLWRATLEAYFSSSPTIGLFTLLPGQLEADFKQEHQVLPSEDGEEDGGLYKTLNVHYSDTMAVTFANMVADAIKKRAALEKLQAGLHVRVQANSPSK
jgi:hypothetical protein